jgi:hypothetical protein
MAGKVGRVEEGSRVVGKWSEVSCSGGSPIGNELRPRAMVEVAVEEKRVAMVWGKGAGRGQEKGLGRGIEAVFLYPSPRWPTGGRQHGGAIHGGEEVEDAADRWAQGE